MCVSKSVTMHFMYKSHEDGSLVYMQHKPVKLQSVHHSMKKLLKLTFKLGCFDFEIKQKCTSRCAEHKTFMFTKRVKI